MNVTVLDNMHIRQAVLSDVDTLTTVLIDFKEGLTDYEPEDLKVFRQKHKSEDSIKQAVTSEIDNEHGLFLVIEDEDTIIGFGFGTVEENNHMVFETLTYGMLQHIWIHQDYRRRGLASELKEQLFDWFRQNDCSYVRLRVLDTNPAKQLYAKWGFEIVLDSMVKVL